VLRQDRRGVKKIGAGRLHDCDIAIGDGRWLRWIDITDDRRNDVDLDPRLAGLAPLWLETECIHECCGIDAFDLTPAAIATAVPAAQRPESVRALSALRDWVSALPDDAVLCSAQLGQRFHRDLLLALIAHLRTCVESDDGALA
jgi:hypothetical protein